MSTIPNHVFMLLTKRPEHMKKAVDSLGERWIGNVFPHSDAGRACPPWPIPNVWLGVTVCNQTEADVKIPILLSTPAAKRFVSIEPMLGPVDLSHEEFSPLDWVICGGETGPGARPMDPDWARSVRDQCKNAGVPFFFKQMAGKTAIPADLNIREIPA